MRVGYIFGLSLQSELLILSFFGILYTIFDASLLEFNSNLIKIWNMKMDPVLFSERVELGLKYVISGVVMVRTFTIHIYLGTYIIMLYPLIFEDRPRLLIPWMAINLFKCLATDLISFLSGVYICLMYNWTKPSCWEFLLSNISYYAPSVYMFYLVLTFYRELKKLMKIHKYIDPVELKARRRRARLVNEQKNESEYKDTYTRSLDGLVKKRQVPDEITMPTLRAQSSGNPFDVNAIDLSTGSRWPEANVTTYSIRDAAVSGRSFRVSGTVLQVLAHTHSKPKEVLPEPAGIDKMEKIQKVSNLDSHDTKFQAPPPIMLTVETQATPIKDAIIKDAAKKAAEDSEYNTVSDLLNDPNIALVLNMITGKDDPWETDMSKLKNYEITITEEENSMWGYPTYSHHYEKPKEPKLQKKESELFDLNWQRTETHDAGSQVTSPLFETVMGSLNILKLNDDDIHEPPQKDTSVAPLEPSLVTQTPSSLYPQMEGPRAHKRSRSQSPDVNQIYKNQAAYPRTYKDDGYTQAFIANMAKKNDLQQ